MNGPARASVPVVWRQRPFIGALKYRTLDVSARIPTIAEIVASIPAHELQSGFAECGEVRINGDVVPRGAWHLVRPRYRPDRETVVTLHVPLQHPGSSGGSTSSAGGKSTLATVASIAVLLIAAAVSSGALAGLNLFLGAGALSAGSAGALIAGSAIGVGGTVEISALEKRT